MHFAGTKSSPLILLLLKYKILSSHGGFLTVAMKLEQWSQSFHRNGNKLF